MRLFSRLIMYNDKTEKQVHFTLNAAFFHSTSKISRNMAAWYAEFSVFPWLRFKYNIAQYHNDSLMLTILFFFHSEFILND